MKKILLSVTSLIIFLSCNEAGKEKTSGAKKHTPGIPSEKFELLQKDQQVCKLVCQNWSISDAVPPKPKDLESFGEMVRGIPSLYILSDGSIVENALSDIIRFGRFVCDGKTLKATFDDGGSSTFVVKSITPYNGKFSRVEKGEETLLTVTAHGYSHKNPADNPFHPQYNHWRIKPKKQEDDVALKQRLNNYMQFYIRYFADILEQNTTTVDFAGLPCCFNWFKGGLTIQSPKNLDEKWINCFYSRDQALKARDILEKAVLRKHKWTPDIPNWVEQTLPILKSIRDSII